MTRAKNVTNNLRAGDEEMQKRIDYARQVLQETNAAIETAANRHIKRFEKKHKIRTYQSGDTVLIDVGKKTKVKKYMDKQPAVVIKSFSAGQYTAVMLAGGNKGEVFQADVDQIEPFFVRENSEHFDKIKSEREKIAKGEYAEILPVNKGKKELHLPLISSQRHQQRSKSQSPQHHQQLQWLWTRRLNLLKRQIQRSEANLTDGNLPVPAKSKVLVKPVNNQRELLPTLSRREVNIFRFFSNYFQLF